MPRRPPGLRVGGRPPSPIPTSSGTVSHGPTRVRVPTRIGRATGTPGSSDRFALSAVRALPLKRSPKRRGRREADHTSGKHDVLLQATDGHQAVCVLTQGHVDAPALVPGEALPTKYAGGPAGVTLDGGQWRSSDGREASPVQGTAEFPEFGSVLPEIESRESRSKRRPRRQSESGQPPSPITLAINVDRLRRIAAGLGTGNVTLLISPNPSGTGDPANVAVPKPIAVCPADDDAADGVGVMLSVPSKRGAGYYARIRTTVLAAEKSAGITTTRKGVPA